jgi:hypothetical protein
MIDGGGGDDDNGSHFYLFRGCIVRRKGSQAITNNKFNSPIQFHLMYCSIALLTLPAPVDIFSARRSKTFRVALRTAGA